MSHGSTEETDIWSHLPKVIQLPPGRSPRSVCLHCHEHMGMPPPQLLAHENLQVGCSLPANVRPVSLGLRKPLKEMLLLFFNKSDALLRLNISHSVDPVLLGRTIPGNFSFKFGAKELYSASVLPVRRKLASDQAPLISCIIPLGASSILICFGLSNSWYSPSDTSQLPEWVCRLSGFKPLSASC